MKNGLIKMNCRHCLYEDRCLCNDESFFVKYPKSSDISEGKRFAYPEEGYSKNFQIKSEKPLTIKAKLLLNSFKNKYIYYAIDDIKTILYSNPSEQDNLLTVLYSSMLSLHNNLYINFFDIWIDEIYIHETNKNNRFLKNDSKNLQPLTQITLKLFYKTRLPFKKPDPLW
jgi:hypothetical protein